MDAVQGERSVKWTPGTDQYGHPNISIRFNRATCLACPKRGECIRSKQATRLLTIRPQAEYEALREARKEQQGEEFKREYAQQARIEGTLSQGVRGYGLRRSRYRGLAKSHLQNVMIATAMNLVRLDAYLSGKKAAKTRVSHFAALAPTLVLAS